MIENEYGDNITTFAYPQNLRRFSAPTKQYEKKIFDELIVDLNPVMTWMLTNVEIQIDVNNNYKPLKRYRSSNKRIDGVITSIMALDRCIVNSNNIVENNLTFEELKGLF
jgi:phage terminase large subunit-like protein